MSSSATPVSICNGALALLGDNLITSLTDNSNSAQLCNLHYATERDALLREHIWSFAKKRAALAQTGSFSDPLNEYSAAFQVPTDYLRFIYGDLPYGYPYSIEGGMILTNTSSLNVCYIGRVTDTSQYDPMFVVALEARLAWKLALAITSKTSLGQSMWQLHQQRVLMAKQANGIESYPDVEDAYDLIYPRNLGSLAVVGPKIFTDPLY